MTQGIFLENTPVNENEHPLDKDLRMGLPGVGNVLGLGRTSDGGINARA